MKHHAIRVSALLAFASLAYAQLEFSVASVKPNRSIFVKGEGSEREKITPSPTGVIVWNTSLRTLIRWAYDLRDNQVAGPGWIDSEHYDISANSDATSTPAELKRMMQRLLAVRFQLVVHQESKELPVYALTIAKKGPKLQTAAGEPQSMRPVGGALEFHNYSMPEFADLFGKRPLKLDRPVIDRTGLTGRYDFKLQFGDNMVDVKHTLESIDRGGIDQYGIIFTALDEQLGLGLKAAKSPVDTLVVDHAERVPIEN